MWHGVSQLSRPFGFAFHFGALEFEWWRRRRLLCFRVVLFYVGSYATSCGGTQSVMVLMSTTSWLSTHGRLKWRPEGAAKGAKQKELISRWRSSVIWDCWQWSSNPEVAKTYLVPWNLHLRGDPGGIWQLFRTLGPPKWRGKMAKSFYFSLLLYLHYLETHAERKWQSDDNNDPGEGCQEPPADPNAYVPFVRWNRKCKGVGKK